MDGRAAIGGADAQLRFVQAIGVQAMAGEGAKRAGGDVFEQGRAAAIRFEPESGGA